MISLRDEPRPEAADVIRSLQHAVMEVSMLTGANEEIAQMSATELRIDTVLYVVQVLSSLLHFLSFRLSILVLVEDVCRNVRSITCNTHRDRFMNTSMYRLYCFMAAMGGVYFL